MQTKGSTLAVTFMTTVTIDKYYKILGVTNKATLDDIKRNYRAKAKILHPDKNKSPDAQEQFILLTEAYECLINLTTGKTKIKQPPVSYANWQKQNRDKARERARRYAQMQYEEFIKTDEYKFMVSVTTVTEHLFFFISILILIVLPLVCTIIYGVKGLIISFIIMFVTIPVTSKGLRYSKKLNSKYFFASTSSIVKSWPFKITLISILNIVLILAIGFQTLISLYLLFLIPIILSITALLFTKFVLKLNGKYKIAFIAFCLTPLMFNLFLLTNYVFSHDPVKETYKYFQETQRTKRGTQNSSFIILENNAYEQYPGIRSFMDYQKMESKNKVNYTFKTGLFGLRVMTDYSFD